MSGMDAFKEEMRFLDLTAEEAREMDGFALATRATLMAVPDPAIGRNIVPELATAAAAGHRDNVVAAPVTARPPRRRRRLPMVARIVFAVALLPALFAGLAFAGVKLPDPATNAFESMGVSLPNQDSDTSATDDGTEPGEQGKGAGQDKSNPAREGGRGNGAQGNGRALGKRGIPPGHKKSKSNHAGGNGKGKAIGKTDSTPPGQAKEKPAPPGQAKTPPVKDNANANAGSNAGGGGGGASQNAAGGGAGGNGQGAVNKTVSNVKSLLD